MRSFLLVTCRLLWKVQRWFFRFKTLMSRKSIGVRGARFGSQSSPLAHSSCAFIIFYSNKCLRHFRKVFLHVHACPAKWWRVKTIQVLLILPLQLTHFKLLERLQSSLVSSWKFQILCFLVIISLRPLFNTIWCLLPAINEHHIKPVLFSLLNSIRSAVTCFINIDLKILSFESEY